MRSTSFVRHDKPHSRVVSVAGAILFAVLLSACVGCTEQKVTIRKTPSDTATSQPEEMPDLVGLTIREAESLMGGYDGMVRFPTEEVTYTVKAGYLCGIEMPAHVGTVSRGARNLPLEDAITDHYVVKYQRPEAGESLPTTRSIFFHAVPDPRLKTPWLGSGHADSVRKSRDDRECLECHLPGRCNNCHANP